MVSAFTALPNGDIMVGGNFTTAGAAPSAWFARLSTTCPATAASFGSGCSGSGGLNVLTATALPWVGSTYVGEATGLAANALAIGLRGLSTVSIPLQNLLPQGVLGCTLLAAPEAIDLYVPTNGTVVTEFGIPNTSLLAGIAIHQQVVSLEFGPLGDITALTGTNGLTMTIGAF